MSGAILKTINVCAQVTSLLWSNSQREICATLGYANPEHPVRIVVYSWPECQQVVSVPWVEEMRALYAVAYPGGPAVSEGCGPHDSNTDEDSDEDGLLRDLRTRRGHRRQSKPTEGCIVVAASDETVRFHEVWSNTRRGVMRWRGVLGGSDILEQSEGIEADDGQLIR
jgi:meiosis-specific APC/C activator protein AMA1